MTCASGYGNAGDNGECGKKRLEIGRHVMCFSYIEYIMVLSVIIRNSKCKMKKYLSLSLIYIYNGKSLNYYYEIQGERIYR